MSRATDIADAIVAELESQEFSQVFSPARAYLPIFDLESGGLDDLQVSVVPRTESSSDEARGGNAGAKYVLEIDIGIHKRVTRDDTNTLDALMDLSQEIFDYYDDKHTIEGRNQCFAWDVSRDPLFSQQLLDTHSVFASLVTVTIWEFA